MLVVLFVINGNAKFLMFRRRRQGFWAAPGLRYGPIELRSPSVVSLTLTISPFPDFLDA